MATNLWSQTQQKYAQQATPGVSTSAVNTPSSTGSYTTNVNTALKGKGVRPEHIGYNANTNAYSVNGKPFMRANKNYGGAGYTSAHDFAQAWKSYNQQPNQQAQPTTTGYNPYASSASNNNPYNQQVNDTISYLMNAAQHPQAIDPYSTAEYAAANAQAQRAAGQNIRAAQEAYGSAGFGRSYGLGERVNGIQNDATNYLMTQVVPNIIAAKQAEQQNQFNNSISALNQLIGQQSRADQQVQQDWTNNYNKGQLLGSFTDPAAMALYNSVTGAKRTYADAATRGDRAAMDSARAQADAARVQLQNMGYDTSGYGANKTLETALQGGAPSIRTLGGQSQDLANKQANLNAAESYMNQSGLLLHPQEDWSGLPRQIAAGGEGQTMEGQQVTSGLVTEQQQRDLATRSAALQEWQTTGHATPAVSQILGVPEGTLTNDAAYRKAAQDLDSDMFKYQQMQDKAAAQNKQATTMSPVDAGNLISSSLSSIVDQIKQAQKEGQDTKPLEDQLSKAKEDAFVQLYNDYGISGKDMVSALTKAGYTMEEINKLKSDPDYAPVFQ
jgi:hypothetical protein